MKLLKANLICLLIWTARYKECIENAVDIRFKEFIKNIHKKQNKQNNE